jgi:hypothetical protein
MEGGSPSPDPSPSLNPAYKRHKRGYRARLRPLSSSGDVAGSGSGDVDGSSLDKTGPIASEPTACPECHWREQEKARRQRFASRLMWMTGVLPRQQTSRPQQPTPPSRWMWRATASTRAPWCAMCFDARERPATVPAEFRACTGRAATARQLPPGLRTSSAQAIRCLCWFEWGGACGQAEHTRPVYTFQPA